MNNITINKPWIKEVVESDTITMFKKHLDRHKRPDTE